MSGKTVRIDFKSYTLLLKVQAQTPGMSLSDLADIAIQKTYGEGVLMASDTISEELLKAKDDQITDLKESLERERKLVDALTQLIENVGVSKYSQTDTQLKKN